MLEHFIDGNPPDSPVVLFLSVIASAKFDEMHDILKERREEYLRVLDQSGY